MSACILFIDSDHAKIFSLNPEKIETNALKKHGAGAHHKDDKNDEQEKHFFKVVTQSLTQATQLLIVGPGQAKTRYQSHLETHHHDQLAKSVVGVENIDQTTDAKILEVGRKFFKDYDKFH